MRVQQPHTPSDGRFRTAADSKPGRSRDFRKLAALLLVACLGIAMLAWPGSTRSARQQDPASVTVDPATGFAGSTFSISATSFPSYTDQYPAFFQFDMNGQPVTIGQQTIARCPYTRALVYGFGRSCGPDVLVTVPAGAAPGPHTVTVHVPNANPLLVGGSYDVQTTYTVIAQDTATPTNTDTPTATSTATQTPTATSLTSASPTSTATATATSLTNASATNTATAIANSTSLVTSTPNRATATLTATATSTPRRPVALLVQPLFSIGKLVLTVRGQPLAPVNISLAIERGQKGALATVYRLKKTGTLDTAGSFSTVLPITYHGRGLAALVVIVHSASKIVRLSRTYHYSG
ncbi:MAG: hypothetical protein JWO42_931 [Chloroflexi bacterium]|nr:hypothetical protein [Chloroflexota bacterium]